MEGIEEKLGAILSNPEMMNNIMSMAKALGQSQGSPEGQPKPEPVSQKTAPPKSPPPIGSPELEMISRIASLSQQTGLDRQEQALLKALNPYLSRERLTKLERAMHAAKMARFATIALDRSSSPTKIGR